MRLRYSLSPARAVSGGAAIVGAAASASVLLSWVLGAAASSGTPWHFGAMKPNTAMGLLLVGISLWLSGREPGASRRWAQGCAILASVLGFLTLLEYALGWQLGIDGMFVGPSLAVDAIRMSVETALCLVALGLALTLATRGHDWSAQFLAAGVLIVAGIGMLGYVYRVERVWGAHYPWITLSTAAVSGILSLGLLLLHPHTGPMEVFASQTSLGAISRRLLVVSCTVPPVVALLAVEALEARVFSVRIIAELAAIVTVLLLTGALWWSARFGLAIEADRGRLAAMVEDSVDAIFSHSLDGTILTWNRGAEALCGYASEEVIGRPLSMLLPRGEAVDLLSKVRSGQPVPRFDAQLVTRSGQAVHVSMTVSPLPDAMGTVTAVSLAARDVTHRKEAEAALRRSRDLLDATGQMAKVGGWEIDLETGTLTWSDEVYRIHEVDPAMQPTVATAIDFYAPEARPVIAAAVQAAIDSGTPWDLELPLITATGRRIWVRAQGATEFREGEPIRVYGAFQDVTEHHRAEQMLRQSQKTEALGRLAEGVAHDFNNLLGVITGYGGLALRQLADGHPARSRLEQILTAANRAASLTRQLLTYTRKQMVEAKPIAVNKVLDETNKMLGRLIGEHIDLAVRLAPDLGIVIADPGQVQQIILNLAVNARDAMPEGGTLTIETANVDLDEGYAATHQDVAPGPYVLLAMSDTGIGMSEEVQSHLFEPFFTTKPEGQGTGLGLATVYGVVKQCGGHISVYSEPGHGTTFKIYLPRTDAATEPEGAGPSPRLVGGTETVLVVEDTESLREVIREQLAEVGYTVLLAPNGEAAQTLAREHWGPIHLLLTDVVMPKMKGTELAKALLDERPGLLVLYMSGYPKGAAWNQGVPGGGQLIEKPFPAEKLLRVVRETLDRGDHPSPA